jgi:predicted amidophosphoribosyltransferase
MTDPYAVTPAGRATAVFEPEPSPLLRCSHCKSEITDDDADCPTCTTPLDWGASFTDLQSWQKATGS